MTSNDEDTVTDDAAEKSAFVSKDRSQTNWSASLNNVWSNKYHFFTYVILFMFIGLFFSIPDTVFNEMSIQLDVAEQTIAYLYIFFSVAGVIFCILAGVLVDKLERIHTVIAIFCLVGSTALCCMYFIDSFAWMALVWVIMAAVSYLVEVSTVVLLFRVFHIDASWLVAFYYVVATISSTIVAPLFNAVLGRYFIVMFVFASFGVVSSIALLIVKTPQRRTLVANIETIESSLVQSNGDAGASTSAADYVQKMKRFKQEHSSIPKIGIADRRYFSPYIQSECVANPAVAREVNAVCKAVRDMRPVAAQPPSVSDSSNGSSYPMDTKLMVLALFFNDTTGAILPYSDKTYWFDFEQKKAAKRRQETLPKNETNMFAVIGILNILMRIMQRVTFNAFIIALAVQHFAYAESTGFYLITTFWMGSLAGRILTVFIVQAFMPENVLLFFAMCLIVNSILFVATLEMNAQNAFTQILLYFVAFFGGLAATPMHSANLAFLSRIQPISGTLSSLIYSAEAIGRGITAWLVAVLISAFGIKAQAYVYAVTSAIIAILMVVNKIRYVLFLRNR